MRTNTLRCGYWDWKPVFWRDDKTSERHGIFFDVMEEIGRISNLKIEWTQEVQFAHLITDLQEGRVDAVCAGVWTSATRGRQILFSQPVFYVPINAYAKVGDKRFDSNLDAMNKADVKISVMDGEMSSEIKTADFAQAKEVSVPQIAGGGSEFLILVATGKADATFTDAVTGGEFIKANPGKIREVVTAAPVRIMPNTIAIAGDELRFKAFLDTALQQLENSGVIEKVLKKYDAQFPGAQVRTAKMYEVKN